MTRGRVPVVLQVANSDCGPAALAMVLGGFGYRVPVAQVREVLDAGRDGVTALDLREAALEFGLNCRAFDLPDLRTDPSVLRRLPLPLIAHWNDDHFVVVDSVGPGVVGVVDPAMGRVRMRHDTARAGLTGVVLVFEPGRAPVRRHTGPGPVRAMLLPVVLRHRGMLALVAAASLLLVLAGLGVPAVTTQIVDALATTGGPGTRWLAAVAVLAALSGALNMARALAIVVLQRRLGRDVTAGTVRALFAAAYRYFERRDSGDLVARVRSATAISQILTSSLVSAVLDAVLATGYVIVVAVIAPALAVAAAALIVVQLAVTTAITSGTRTLQREELLAAAQQTSRLVDAVAGAASIRAAGADGWVLERWAQSFERELSASYRRARLSSVAQSGLSAVGLAAPLLLLFVAARTTGGQPGTAVGLAALAAAAVTPAGSLAQGLFSLAQLAPLVDRLADVAAAPAEQPAPRPPAPALKGWVELRDVGFRYDRRSPYAIRSVNVVVAPGMKIGVIGASGSGKSTLAKLLTGLHPPTEGSIRFDGHDLAELDLTSLRRQLGVVMQEPFLTAGTVREALALGHPDATDAQVERAARLAVIHDDILAMPMGYQTRLGDAGRGLSGGQRQRLALARALLAEPAVLVLDEATSALDVETEARVEANLRRLSMTRIVVAHRLTTVADADLILVLEGGQVVRRGTPDAVLGRSREVVAPLLGS